MFARPCALIVGLVFATPVAAAPITSLHSTGLGAAGAADPHYTLTSAPAGSGYATAFIVNQNGSFPFDAYWAPGGYSPAGAPASGWIAPTANVNTTHPDGYYTYRTTFDLTGFDPATATITGFIAADNGVRVYLNDSATPAAGMYASNGYTFTPAAFANQSLSITGGFRPGINTLDFVVSNEVQSSGNPTGLRVALSGSATPAATPEPATLAVFGGGLIGLAGYIRRRRYAG